MYQYVNENHSGYPTFGLTFGKPSEFKWTFQGES